MILYRVIAPHLCAGLTAAGGRVIDAAPILGWAKGRPITEILAYVGRKGWAWEIVPC